MDGDSLDNTTNSTDAGGRETNQSLAEAACGRVLASRLCPIGRLGCAVEAEYGGPCIDKRPSVNPRSSALDAEDSNTVSHLCSPLETTWTLVAKIWRTHPGSTSSNQFIRNRESAYRASANLRSMKRAQLLSPLSCGLSPVLGWLFVIASTGFNAQLTWGPHVCCCAPYR